MEKWHNPSSPKRLRGDTPNSWSELPLDLLTAIFERLSYANFQRAKSVCSSWHSGSRQSVPIQIPWLILFPEYDNNNSCTLFNPEEKGKVYKMKDLGVEFSKSICTATYGSWLLMRDPLYNLYILNLFTHERINLPPFESQLGMVKIERTIYDWFHSTLHYNGKEYHKRIRILSPVFWIDEKTKDYVVIWGLGSSCVVYSKKGDKCWNQILETPNCHHMVYKDHKLYFSTSTYKYEFRIFDFSREIPQQIFQGYVIMQGLTLNRHRGQPGYPFATIDTKLVVTVTGDVLKVDRIVEKETRICRFFYVYKVYSSGSYKKYEKVESLGDEAILLDLGITMLANDTVGLLGNSIYFSGTHTKSKVINDTFIFSLETQKMDPVHKFDCSSAQLSSARWFLPSSHKLD
ncbi:F-box-like domain superfamily [Arabidopsis thaliana x Arabidopsis arenosa]|uniref:F-box-like domain superfamily n=2 Tax=Arabidopsis TaxID=3701 RepID=A0A8T2EPH0_ARASU|nr:F-box-like domain superfamily [Arabidopsis thaliana x Arabidopsis arenosa]KAG7621371.1 F-box-like domain superfamily [Arabidopsis suecica]